MAHRAQSTAAQQGRRTLVLTRAESLDKRGQADPRAS
jgi:hypothetical protein